MSDRADSVESSAFLPMMRIRPFAVLFAAEAQSLVGDQFARVALSVLVWTRTGSAAATALTYGLTFLPAVLGGFLLARVGDRFPRLDVVVSCDVVRAALFTAMVLPGVPLLVLEALLVCAVLLEPVFTATQSSYLAACLTDEQYRAATGFRMAMNQLCQIGGFALGGTVVVLLDPRRALAINAISFLVSAVVIDVGLRRRHAGGDAGSPASPGSWPTPEAEQHRSAPSPWRIRNHPRILQLLALTSLAGLFVVPEGLAFPYAVEVGLSPRVGGLLLAAIPAGGALGALVLLRFVGPQHRRPVALVMATTCGIPLVTTAAMPWWPTVGAAWFLSGILAAYQVEVFAELARITPDEHRSRTMGAAGGLLTSAQGVGLAAFGLIAQHVEIGTAVALAGLTGIVLAVAIVLRGHHGQEHQVAEPAAVGVG